MPRGTEDTTPEEWVRIWERTATLHRASAESLREKSCPEAAARMDELADRADKSAAYARTFIS